MHHSATYLHHPSKHLGNQIAFYLAAQMWYLIQVLLTSPGSYHTPEVRGGRREEQPHVQEAAAVWAQEGREELLHIQGQEGRPWGDTPHPR